MNDVYYASGVFDSGDTYSTCAEIIAIGRLSSHLVGGPQSTFFRFRYFRHTNFALNKVGNKFDNVAFTEERPLQRSTCIPRFAGDLMYTIDLVMEVPGIYGVSHEPKVPQSPCPCPSPSRTSRTTYRTLDQQTGQYDEYAPYYYSQEPSSRYLSSQNASSNNQKAEWLRRTYGGYYDPNATSEQAQDGYYNQSNNNIDQNGSTTNGSSATPWVRWTNALGLFMPGCLTMVVGGKQTYVTFNHFLYAWDCLSGKAGKRLGAMVGKRKKVSQLLEDAKCNQRFYLPIPWSFCTVSGNALPVLRLEANSVEIHVDWEFLSRCVVKSSNNVSVHKAIDGSLLTAKDLRAWLDITFIHLDEPERVKFISKPIDQLITQTQFICTQPISDTIDIPLEYNYPCIEIIWMVLMKDNENNNNHFTYSGIDGLDPVKGVTLTVNGKVKMGGREGSYYRKVPARDHHSSIPKEYIYCIIWALHPEDPQPSGSLDQGKARTHLILNLQPGLSKRGCLIIVNTRNLNMMRFKDHNVHLLLDGREN